MLLSSFVVLEDPTKIIIIIITVVIVVAIIIVKVFNSFLIHKKYYVEFRQE